jgi:hypothetical protein
MDPYYRFFPLGNPLSMICWNAVWGCDTYERLLEQPQEAETLTDVRHRHVARMLADGITHSARDPMPARTPYFCYLGYALGDFGILPLGGRFKLRWYPMDNVRALWEANLADSKVALATAVSRIEKKYGVELRGPPAGSLP